MKTKTTITLKEHLAALNHAAYILLRQRPYARGLDPWDIINGAWVIMEDNNSIQKLIDRDQKWGLLTSCINAGRKYLRKTYNLGTNHRADLAFLDISINGDDGIIFDKPDSVNTPEETAGTSELFQHVMGIARRVLTVNEYRTIELYFMQGLRQQDVAHCLGLRSRGGTSDRLKLAIQKIRNELSVTGNLLETL